MLSKNLRPHIRDILGSFLMLTNRRTQVNTSESFNLTLTLINVVSLGLCTGKGLTVATSAPGLGTRLPRLLKDWAHRCHTCSSTWPSPSQICTRTGLIPATSTGFTNTTSAPGLGTSAPHLHQVAAMHYSRVLTGSHGYSRAPHHTTPHHTLRGRQHAPSGGSAQRRGIGVPMASLGSSTL
jgi:hypothetical protein